MYVLTGKSLERSAKFPFKVKNVKLPKGIPVLSTRAARCYNSLFRRCLGSPSNFKAYNHVLSCEGLARSRFFKAQSQSRKS